MRLQRVRVCPVGGIAESRTEMQVVKWTAEGMVKCHDVTHTLVARDMYVSCRGYGRFAHKSRWHRG